VIEARRLLELHHQRSESLREHYGIEARQKEGVDTETMERLKALGYMN
jgi:hypothetical protein